MKRKRRQVLMAIGGMATGTFALQEYARRKEPTDYPTDTGYGNVEDAETGSDEATSRAHSHRGSGGKPTAAVEILGVGTRPTERADEGAMRVVSVRVSVENTGDAPFAPRVEVERRTKRDGIDTVARDLRRLDAGRSREARIPLTDPELTVRQGGSARLSVRLLADSDEVARDETVVEG